MQIQDAIHGYIHLNELEEALLDTPEMQRLRRVSQLGFSNLVYPSATHTRFEHSLGAFHLADRFADSLRVGEGRAQELRLAALFHDLGHGPFSHATDFIFHEHGFSHEHFSKQKIRDSRIADILNEHGIHPERIIDLIDGEGRLGGIIAGHIDVDRMDYLMRDAHYTGVAYGTIDADTIIRSAQIHEEELVFDGKYVNALESLLTARYLMIPTVYTHRTSRIASRMYRKAFELYQEDSDITVENLADIDDAEMRERLRQSDAASWLMERVEHRELYKVAATFEDVNRDEDTVEDALLDETGLERGELLVDAIKLEDARTYDVPILVDGTVRSIENVSDLPPALQQSLTGPRELRIYAAEDDLDAVADAAEAVV